MSDKAIDLLKTFINEITKDIMDIQSQILMTQVEIKFRENEIEEKMKVKVDYLSALSILQSQ